MSIVAEKIIQQKGDPLVATGKAQTLSEASERDLFQRVLLLILSAGALGKKSIRVWF